MIEEDKVLMSVKELRRLAVLHQVMEKKLGQLEASRLLGLTDRQIRRIVTRIQVEGDVGLAHRSRGKRSNRAFDERKKTQVLGLYAKQYCDFGPTLAAEKLKERNGIGISDETLRLWLLGQNRMLFGCCRDPDGWIASCLVWRSRTQVRPHGLRR